MVHRIFLGSRAHGTLGVDIGSDGDDGVSPSNEREKRLSEPEWTIPKKTAKPGRNKITLADYMPTNRYQELAIEEDDEHQKPPREVAMRSSMDRASASKLKAPAVAAEDAAGSPDASSAPGLGREAMRAGAQRIPRQPMHSDPVVGCPEVWKAAAARISGRTNEKRGSRGTGIDAIPGLRRSEPKVTNPVAVADPSAAAAGSMSPRRSGPNATRQSGTGGRALLLDLADTSVGLTATPMLRFTLPRK